MAGVLGDHVATPPPPDFRGFVRAVCVFGLALLVLAALTGNVH